MVKEVRINRDYTERTIATARWARDQIKRQTGRLHLFSESAMQKPNGVWIGRNWVPTYPHSLPPNGWSLDNESEMSYGDESLYG